MVKAEQEGALITLLANINYLACDIDYEYPMRTAFLEVLSH